MEIRNNTPMNSTSFGMAFKKPSADQMQNFVEYVGKGVSGKRAKKGLQVLQEQQAGNRHFDIVYGDSNSFSVVPKSEAARRIGSTTLFPSTAKHKSAFDIYGDKIQKRMSEIQAKQGRRLTKWQRAKIIITCMPKACVLAVKESRNPLAVLPGNLQLAAEKATAAERHVDHVIAKENTIKSAFPLD